MGTRDFLNKYRLELTSNFPYDKFIQDLANTFIEQIELNDGYSSMKSFRFCINSIRVIWDNINSVSYKPLPEFLWKQFYRNIVCMEREKVKDFDPDIVKGQALKSINKNKSYNQI